METAPATAPFSPAEELRAAFWKLKKGRIRVSGARSTRAGSIGHDCERFIFYERTASELRTPHTEGLQCIFDLGNALEPIVIREIEAMGFEVVQRQRDHFDRTYEIGARADVSLRRPGWPRAITTEIKGLASHVADSIETLDDIRGSRLPHLRRYYSQLQTYLYLEGEGSDLGLFAFLNKGSGQIRFYDCPRDQAHIDKLLAKAARVRDAVRANEPLPRHETEDCGRCPFQHICLPDRTFGPGVQLLDSDEAAALIARKLELADAVSEANAIDRSLKKLLPEVPELLVGDFVVTAKLVHRDGYTVAPSAYWQRKFSQLNPNGGTH